MTRALTEAAYMPAILVTTQTTSGRTQLSFCDNGAALDPEQVSQLYAAIRSGRIGTIRRAVEGGTADGVVGRLGVALLASFAIADQIIICTRGGLGPGTRYTCDTRTYRSERYVVSRPGTVIQLRVRRERGELHDIATVRAALMPHARELELPIRVGADPNPL